MTREEFKEFVKTLQAEQSTYSNMASASVVTAKEVSQYDAVLAQKIAKVGESFQDLVDYAKLRAEK